MHGAPATTLKKMGEAPTVYEMVLSYRSSWTGRRVGSRRRGSEFTIDVSERSSRELAARADGLRRLSRCPLHALRFSSGHAGLKRPRQCRHIFCLPAAVTAQSRFAGQSNPPLFGLSQRARHCFQVWVNFVAKRESIPPNHEDIFQTHWLAANNMSMTMRPTLPSVTSRRISRRCLKANGQADKISPGKLANGPWPIPESTCWEHKNSRLLAPGDRSHRPCCEPASSPRQSHLPPTCSRRSTLRSSFHPPLLCSAQPSPKPQHQTT
ncbi:hypothetical protein B0T22DRAFT_242419 [Podospora appendiculata]|uniref:Uncharacterized protein n=1 Tax=Podospora appendiculata TaxID=314037 RepID=A0AAE0X6T8_9PEZI|nr:hypothetical protein B0T22DRAFT_242419 [Podospora appendiculata]